MVTGFITQLTETAVAYTFRTAMKIRRVANTRRNFMI